MVAAAIRSARKPSVMPARRFCRFWASLPVGHDQVLEGGICNERVDAAVGINEAGNDSEPEFLFREGLEHLVASIVENAYRPAAPLGRIRTSVSLRYGFEKYANALRDCSWSRRPRYPQSRRPAPPDARSRRFPAGGFPRPGCAPMRARFPRRSRSEPEPRACNPGTDKDPRGTAPRSGSACGFRALTSGFGDTGVCAAAMPADARQAGMTAANRAIILGHELPQTLARRCRM